MAVKMKHSYQIYRKYIKRPLDFLLSLLALIVLFPVIAVIALLVRIKLGSPVIFCQERPGLHEKLFKLYKFRTMADQRDEMGNLLPDLVRLTPFGKLLRSMSLDELPELFNILRGDMAIVGPRPLLVQYLPLYNQQQRKRHQVRPGLTGLAQINGRNTISWEEKFNMDIQYIENIRFTEDLKIMIRTLKKVILREGIHSNTCITMEPFKADDGL